MIVDIETGPLSEDVIRTRVQPFLNPTKHPGEFRESDVKIGNLKDKLKIAEKIAAAREKHESECAGYEKKVAEAEAGWWMGVLEAAPLNALTGMVLAIGYYAVKDGKPAVIVDDVKHNPRKEEGVLQRFWEVYKKAREVGAKIIGHNLLGFDLPFIFQRSLMLSVDVPDEFLDKGRYIENTTFADTMLVWACGQRKFIGLDNLAQAFGVRGKEQGEEFELSTGEKFELCGKNFWRFFTDNEVNRLRAIGYLRADLIATADVAERMGVE